MRYRVTLREKGEVTYVPVTGDLAHAGAMAYLAVLAYPLKSEWDKRDRFIEHLKGRLAKNYLGPWGSPERTERRKVLRSEYTQMRRRNIRQVQERAFERINRRLWAGQIALRQLLHGVRFDLQTGVSITIRCKHSVRSLVPDFQKLNKMVRWDEEKFRMRVWRSVQPVLHLAMVYPKNEDGLSYKYPFELVIRPEWLEPALLKAKNFLPWIAQRIPSFDSQAVVHLLPVPR